MKSIASAPKAAMIEEFERLVRAARPNAYALALRLTGHPAEAEDLTQEAFVSAWAHFQRFDRARSFQRWICRMVTNRAVDLYRRRRIVHFCSLDALASSNECPWTQDAQADPEELFLRNEMDARLVKALERLPHHYREPLMAAVIRQEAHSAIAARLHCSVPTIRSRIHRARQMMRLLLADPVTEPAESIS
ncbi:MAG: RNA polymerase sigma factor [Chthonomonadales bacterium]